MVNPLNPVTDEINRAIEAELYFLPVVLSATLPDICAALESDNGRTNQEKYKKWFERWASKRMSYITADDCYSFRCGVVHQGKMGDLSHNVSRIVFPLPGNVSLKNCKINDVYVYGVREFCADMVECTTQWYEDRCKDENVVRNAQKLMRVHPDGLHPYISGVPVLA